MIFKPGRDTRCLSVRDYTIAWWEIVWIHYLFLLPRVTLYASERANIYSCRHALTADQSNVEKVGRDERRKEFSIVRVLGRYSIFVCTISGLQPISVLIKSLNWLFSGTMTMILMLVQVVRLIAVQRTATLGNIILWQVHLLWFITSKRVRILQQDTFYNSTHFTSCSR